jgi:glycosyltransferase involved in cell wall biosynthesis
MKIAIAGTRGIPNNYGGFEQCAEFMSVILVQKGHEVIVYNSHNHPYQNDSYNGVQVVHIFNPENIIGTSGNFFYDFACMRHAIKNEVDVLLVLGYTTASVFFPFLKFGKTTLITNMDGLEWKRDKWNSVVRKLARWFEKLGALYSHHLVADNPEIKNYLFRQYGKNATCIAYGCMPFDNPNEDVLKNFEVTKFNYGLLIARMEAENNIAMVLEGYSRSAQMGKLLVVGNLSTGYGRKLHSKYKSDERIVFTGGIYDLNQLNNLRHFSKFYFHGHSVGGTNPSLLEAMACKAFIIAHGNEFNRAVLGEDALYFTNPEQLLKHLSNFNDEDSQRSVFINKNYNKVREEYNWESISGKYEQLFLHAVNQ